jgi:hypothetical protein
MQPKAYLSFVGFVTFMAATWCPLLRPFGIVSWNAYDLNKPYGMVMLLVAVIGVAAIVLKQQALARVAAWASLTLVVLLYVAAQLKVNTTFSFIPFKVMASFLAKLIKFKWGWYLLFAGALIAVIGTFKSNSSIEKGTIQ